MSKTHYTVNDDVYGTIIKNHSHLKPSSTYAEVYEEVKGLGMKFQLVIISRTDS